MFNNINILEIIKKHFDNNEIIKVFGRPVLWTVFFDIVLYANDIYSFSFIKGYLNFLAVSLCIKTCKIVVKERKNLKSKKYANSNKEKVEDKKVDSKLEKVKSFNNNIIDKFEKLHNNEILKNFKNEIYNKQNDTNKYVNTLDNQYGDLEDFIKQEEMRIESESKPKTLTRTK